MRRVLPFILGLLLIAFLAFLYFEWNSPKKEPVTPELIHPLIQVDSPLPNALIQSPFEITGEARGNWYFEADFPIRLFDDQKNEIAVAIGTAQGEWMTREFVPFRATLEFETTAKKGVLVFQKNNPSDLRENDDELRIPVRFR